MLTWSVLRFADAKTLTDTFPLEPASPPEVQLQSMPLHEIQEGIVSPSMENLPRTSMFQQQAVEKPLGGLHRRNGSAACLLDFQGGLSSNESTPRHSRTVTMEDFSAQDLSEIVLTVTETSDATPVEQHVG